MDSVGTSSDEFADLPHLGVLDGDLLLQDEVALSDLREGAGNEPMDDVLDMNFLSDLLPPDESLKFDASPARSEVNGASPTDDSLSSDAADTCSSPNNSVARTTENSEQTEHEGQLADRKARRRAQVASSARRTRCRKKMTMLALKKEATFLDLQLETLRSKHMQMRANNAVATWEERAILQRHKRQQAEQANETLRRALFLQRGFVRNLKSLFFETMPCSIELNMRHLLHTPTRLSGDLQSRVQDLGRVCTNSKLDLAKQVIVEETSDVKPFTIPDITVRLLDLGREGFGVNTIAVYALETRNACKTFKATCSAILNCATLWPNHTLVGSSVKPVDLPATKLNIRYGISHNIYECDATGERVYVETREISYCRMTENCGVFLWDYVDCDDMNPLREETTALRCCVGAVVVQPEICADGVERIVCRNICTGLHLADPSTLTPSLERFSKSRELCAKVRASLVYETIKSDAVARL